MYCSRVCRRGLTILDRYGIHLKGGEHDRAIFFWLYELLCLSAGTDNCNAVQKQEEYYLKLERAKRQSGDV